MTADETVVAQLWLFVCLAAARVAGAVDPSGVLPYPASASERQIVGIPTVKEVSAMCSNIGGIHASIEFDRPFSGRVYSLGYGDTHACVYFNGYYARRLLFSIPIDKCGTRLTRNTRDVVDTLENRVYVQMDKFTLTGFDRKYAFVCELTSGEPPAPVAPQPTAPLPAIIPSAAVREIEIRRHPTQKQTANRTPAGSTSGSAEIESATALTPIIPLNVPRGVTPMMPALLYYGNRQWRVPAENVHRKSGGSGDNSVVHPTVIVPIEDRAGEIVAPLTPEFASLEARGLTVGPDELTWNRISSIPDADLLQPTTVPPFVDDSTTTTTASTVAGPDKTSVVPLYTNSADTATRTPPVVVLPYAKQQAVPALENTNGGTRTYIAGSSSASGDDVDRSIFLEIKRDGAEESPVKGRRVDGSVRIGEPITLVVHAKSASKDAKRFDIFVHSCYSSGGSNLTRIQLIDSEGCTVHPLVSGNLRRERIADEIVYYFTMRAFKFPAGDDVHFFCSVDISPDVDFPALCPSGSATPIPFTARLARRSHPDNGGEDDAPAATRRVTRAIRVSNVTYVTGDATDSLSSYERITGSAQDIFPAADTVEEHRRAILLVGGAISALLLAASACIAVILCLTQRRTKTPVAR